MIIGKMKVEGVTSDLLKEETNLKLEAALKYEEMGWAIVPANGKVPCVSWKQYQTVRPTKEQIIKWWTDMPNSNIAVLTGDISGIIVLDIDLKHYRSPEEFELPTTVSSSTANKGWHYFFKYPGYEIKNSAGTLFDGPGVDLRADGGVIILPPSNIDDNQYSWIIEPGSEEIAPLPNWLEEKILDSQKYSTVENIESITTNEDLSEIKEGSRNSKMAEIIGTLLPKFKKEQWKEMVWPITVSLNSTVCKPPLSITELTSVFDSITSRESAKTYGLSEVKPLKIMSAKELSDMAFPEAKWAVEQLFESGTVNMISAAPNQYKSWVTLQIAISLAKGTKLFDEFETTQQSVLIINEEDHGRLVQERMKKSEPNWGDLPIHFGILNGFQLSEKSVNDILDNCKKLGVGFVIFDSLRSIHLEDENSSTAMQAVMNHFKILSTAGITVLFTHHNRKKSAMGKGMGAEETRGSSSINAAIYGHISLDHKKDKETLVEYLVISQDKLKAAKKMDPFKVLIGGLTDTISFTYDGLYVQGKADSKLGVDILKRLESTEKWLTVVDLIDFRIGGDKSIRQAIKELLSEHKVVELEGKDIKIQSLEVLDSSKTIHHNTKYYSLADSASDEVDIDI